MAKITVQTTKKQRTRNSTGTSKPRKTRSDKGKKRGRYK